MKRTTKTCGMCRKRLCRTAFHKDRSRPDKRSYECKTCSKLRFKAWLSVPENKNRRKVADLDSFLKRKYGLKLTEFLDISNKQNNACLICSSVVKTGSRLCVDHDHSTKKVRGLLCDKCNSGLGLFSDNPRHLRKAARYLEPDISGQVTWAVVPKVWGEEHVLVNREMATKILILYPGFKCSLHYHKKKDETFILQEGRCILEWGTEKAAMCVGEPVRILPETPHRFSNPFDRVAKILEVSTHHSDIDVVRLEESGPYES